jgi:hypothetical protein
MTILPLLGCNEALRGIRVQEPTVEYKNFDVIEMDLQQVGFDLGFDLGNPNAFDLPVASLDWNLDLFDDAFSFGRIRFEEAAEGAAAVTEFGGILTYLGVQSIPAGGEISLNAPFTVALLDTFEGISRVAMGEDVPYLIGGTLHFETAFTSFDLPFEVEGVWSNADLIAFVEAAGTGILDSLLD